jgi:hypothetical protein
MSMERELMPISEETEASLALLNLQNVLFYYTEKDPTKLVDLTKPARWETKRRTKDYSIKERRLPADDLRRAVKRMRDSLSFLIPDSSEEATAALIKADIYLANHSGPDRRRELEARREKEIIYHNVDLTEEEIREIREREGLNTE